MMVGDLGRRPFTFAQAELEQLGVIVRIAHLKAHRWKGGSDA